MGFENLFCQQSENFMNFNLVVVNLRKIKK